MDKPLDTSLAAICEAVFSFVAYLRISQRLEAREALHRHVVTLFNGIDRRAREQRFADSDVRDAKYALVALIDETVGWESRLELEFFGSNIAGEEFFNRLEREREAEARDEVLEVYYRCLALGFEGRYLRSPAKLQTYLQEYHERLGEMPPLSPGAARPQESLKPRKRGLTWWIPIATAAASGVGSVVLYLILNHRLGRTATEAIGHIQQLLP